MRLLSNIESLQIQANLMKPVQNVTLFGVFMDFASSQAEGEVAYNVEKCDCQSHFVGNSCEVDISFFLYFHQVN